MEMSKKWILVFWSTFLPSGDTQFSMIFLTICAYWFVHYRCEPYHTNWKIHANLENEMQHLYYAFEILLLAVTYMYSKIGGDGSAWTAVLLCIYFSAVVMMILKCIAFWKRYKAHKGIEDKKNMSKVKSIGNELVDPSACEVGKEPIEGNVSDIERHEDSSNVKMVASVHNKSLKKVYVVNDTEDDKE